MDADSECWWLTVLNQRWADELKEVVWAVLQFNSSDAWKHRQQCAVLVHGTCCFCCCWWWWWWWVCARVCFAGGCCVYVFQQWYTATMNLLGTWLTERMDQQLHVYQLKILIRITKVGTENTHYLITYLRIHHPQSFAPTYRKSTGTSGCRGSSIRPSTARCTTQCATGSPWRRPRLRWGKEACRASPWRTAMRRTKRTTRAHTHRFPNPRPLCSPEPPPPHHNCPFHTFDFSLVTDACTNSDSHSRTSSSARNAYEGTINY